MIRTTCRRNGTFRPFKDGEDFVKNYPFAPYQFQLIQKIFEAFRKAGATGMHLARGEGRRRRGQSVVGKGQLLFEVRHFRLLIGSPVCRRPPPTGVVGSWSSDFATSGTHFLRKMFAVARAARQRFYPLAA